VTERELSEAVLAQRALSLAAGYLSEARYASDDEASGSASWFEPAGFQQAIRGACLFAAATSDVVSAAAALTTTLGAKAARVFAKPLIDVLAALRPASVVDAARLYEELLGLELRAAERAGRRVWEVVPSAARRHGGSHYTAPELARDLALRTLAPLIDRLAPASLLSLKVCDPAAGAGAFLRAAQDVLLDALRAAGVDQDESTLRREIAQRCLRGCDVDPLALWLARSSLGLTDGGSEFAIGNALGELTAPANDHFVSWVEAFPDVFRRENPGFDAVVGNPPWVAYVGRAAQPLADSLARHYSRTFCGFRGYKTLHGLFVEQSGRLLRTHGRLGLILPTSIADLGGYGKTRAAHDAQCDVDSLLPDYGDRFEGVFQPCLGLLSTRRAELVESDGAPWPLERRDLEGAERVLLERLKGMPKAAPELFRERGYQTNARDRKALRPVEDPVLPGECHLYTGSEVTEFARLAARIRVDPSRLSQAFRPVHEWREVAVWVRQTARYPIGALSNGEPFRNSILAVFETPAYDRFLLLAYLNATPVRWYHYQSQRDARQGMPQLKVAHLRALPAPPSRETSAGIELGRLGTALGLGNSGITPAERQRLDELVARYLELGDHEAKLVAEWGRKNPPPVSRFRKDALHGKAAPPGGQPDPPGLRF
jgi:hypothetical protein